MQLVLRTEAADAELDVMLDDSTAGDVTLGDAIVRATGRAAPPAVHVDGRLVPASTPLVDAGLHRASLVDVSPPPGPAPATVPVAAELATVELAIVAGAGAGRRRLLAPGRYRVGPGTGAADLADGIVADGAVEVDAATPAQFDLPDRLLVLRPLGDRRASSPARGPVGPDGTFAVNRPPRPAPEPDPPPIDVPAAARAVSEPRRFPAASLLVPLPVAVGVAAVLAEWRYLLLGLLSPVMLLANWVEDRRSRARDRRRAVRTHDAARLELRRDLVRRHAGDAERARRAHPDLAELLVWAEQVDPRLWERRAGHDDAFIVPVGTGDVPWAPSLTRPTNPIAGVADLVAELGPLPAVPVLADLAAGGIGVVGEHRHAAARGVLLAAVTTHGPADLGVVVLVEAEPATWEWTKWLPHACAPGGAPVVDVETGRRLLAEACRPTAHDRRRRAAPLLLVVADGERWWRARDAPLRGLLHEGSPVRVLALADATAELPAACATVVTAHERGRGTVEHVERRRVDDRVALLLADEDVALDAARALGRLEDPDAPRVDGGGRVPDSAALVELLDLDPDDPAAIAARWRRPGRGPAVAIGAGATGPVVVDLVADGPHGLVAGTTGSGKSELLRSLVAGLAATLPPDELNVVLVDFKGGAAFDACADLPHCVGLVTDLDEHLAGRVLRCLRAELTHRERVLRDAGASSLTELAAAGRASLPRLVLVVDEFASLSAQLPDFVPGLVDIAQRGRSLGFHLVLATQRPAGVVDHRITANANLRLALRVQSDTDSVDVIGGRDAAAIPRHRPGRAFARFGAGELVELQTGLVTGRHDPPRRPPLRLHAYVHHRSLSPLERRVASAAASEPPTAPPVMAAERSDLSRLVVSMRAAAIGRPEPRRPYLEPLPDRLAPAQLTGARADGEVPFALVDRPDEQRQEVRAWRPGTSLAVYGTTGSGTSSLLATLGAGLGAHASPDDAHLYVIDADAGTLAALAGLPHAGAVVRVDEGPRLVRLANFLVGELDRRRAAGPAALSREPSITLLVDNVGALRQALEQDRDLTAVWPRLERVLRDGPALGVGSVVTADHERALPASAAAQITERLVLRLADRHAYSSFGLRPDDLPEMIPGRALCPRQRVELQLVMPPTDLAGAVATAAAAGRAVHRPPPRVDGLPDVVTAGALASHARRTPHGWLVPIGLDLRDGEVCCLSLRAGAGVPVIGPARSGRSSVLETIAATVARVDPTIPIFSVAPRPAGLAAGTIAPATPADVGAWIERVLTGPGRRLVLVDDADALGGPSFERLGRAGGDGLTVVVAGPADRLRAVDHWSRPLLRTRTGLLLAPSTADGDLLRATLPVRLGRVRPGYGYLVVDGEPLPVHCAQPGGRVDAPA